MGKIRALVDFGDKSIKTVTTQFYSVSDACNEHGKALMRSGWLQLDDKRAVNLAEVTILAFEEIEE